VLTTLAFRTSRIDTRPSAPPLATMWACSGSQSMAVTAVLCAAGMVQRAATNRG
jgi:hypothetical protein